MRILEEVTNVCVDSELDREKRYTPPKFNIDPEKLWLVFRGYVKLPGGILYLMSDDSPPVIVVSQLPIFDIRSEVGQRRRSWLVKKNEVKKRIDLSVIGFLKVPGR